MRSNQLNKRNFQSSQGGYSLLEVAIVMLVAGIFIAAAIPLWKIYDEKTKFEDTRTSQKQIDFALSAYKNLRGRYPCPARYDLAAGEAGYGEEILNCNTSITQGAGSCANGVCVEDSKRTVNVGGVNVVPRVIRGAVPFKTLGLSEKDAYDQYDGKFSYAVTSMLTDKKLFRVTRGGISVVDNKTPTPNSIVNPPDSAHYFVFSHGQDNVGAYNAMGTQLIPCNNVMHDNENCNTSSTEKQAVYRLQLRNEQPIILGGVATGPTGPVTSVNEHYDDFASYVGIGLQPMWEVREDNTGQQMEDANLHESIDKKVLMGQDATFDTSGPRSGELMLQVDGVPGKEGIAKTNTRFKTEQICDPGSVDCLPPVLLAAQPYQADPTKLPSASLQCDDKGSNKAPTGVSDKKILCSDVPSNCPTGTYLNGFDENGRVKCISPGVQCPDQTVTLCNINKQLPKSKSGTVITLTEGASLNRVYTCDNGTWKQTSQTGVCACTPGSTTATTATCGANMTGTVTNTTTTVCPSGQKTTVQTGNTCTCVPSTKTTTGSCASGQTGNTTTVTTVTCNGNTPVTTVTPGPSTCVCNPETQNKSINCPAGFNGKIQQQRVRACPSGQWGGYTDISNNCTCKGPTTTDSSCSSNFNTGKVTKTCSWSCNSSALTASESCTTTDTCACVESSNVTYKACPAGYKGNIKVTTEVKCPGAVKKVTEDNSKCVPDTISCTVTRYGSAYQSNSAGQWSDGDTCTMNVGEKTCTQIKTCSVPIGTNLYNIYQCSCQ